MVIDGNLGGLSASGAGGPLPADAVRAELRVALTAAMRSRDRVAVTALRGAIGALDNAESVPTDVRAGAIESSAVGVGTSEVRRRTLTELEVRAVLRQEVEDRETAASVFDGHHDAERAKALRAEAAVLAPFV